MTSSVVSNVLDKVGFVAEYDGQIEVEAIIATHRPEVKWRRLRESLRELTSEEKTIIKRTTYAHQLRKSVITSIDGSQTTSFEMKYRHSNPVNDSENWVRYNVSVEQPVEEPDPKYELMVSTSRDLLRYSYHLEQYPDIRIDLSEVTQKNRQGKVVTIYEVEMEVLHRSASKITEDTIRSLAKCSQYVLCLFNSTDIYYQLTREKLVNTFMNVYLGRVKDVRKAWMKIDRSILNNVSALEMRDIRHGTLISNEVTYGVTRKTDGEKRFLLMFELGIWLILPPYHYNCIFDTVCGIFPSTRTIKDVNIFQVEEIPMSSRLQTSSSIYDKTFKSKYLLEVLDCLVVNGSNITQNALATRIQAGMDMLSSKEFPEELTSMLSIMFKQVSAFHNKKEFFCATNALINQTKTESVKTDGLIFIPLNKPYESEYPIYKWKNAEETTIDFYIGLVDDKVRLYYEGAVEAGSLDDAIIVADRTLVEFTGFDVYTFDPDVEIDDDVRNHVGTISELAYIIPQGAKVGKFHWRRYRPDKVGPNLKSTVRSNWFLVKHPIPTEILFGDGIRLAFSYHRDIKKNMYKHISQDMKEKSDTNSLKLMDFGSGQGADIAFWEPFSVVFCVEPSKDHIYNTDSGLIVRAKKAGWNVVTEDDLHPVVENRTIVVINTIAEDSQRILRVINTTVSLSEWQIACISMMDSATFFWEDRTHLDRVVQTIRDTIAPGGFILWKMLDGDSVRSSILKNEQTTLEVGMRLDIDAFHLEVMEIGDDVRGTRVRVQLPGIVGEQDEYLSNILDLLTLLGSEYKVIESHKADNTDVDSYLLGEQAQKYSRLYRYGIIQRSGQRTEKPRREERSRRVEEKMNDEQRPRSRRVEEREDEQRQRRVERPRRKADEDVTIRGTDVSEYASSVPSTVKRRGARTGTVRRGRF